MLVRVQRKGNPLTLHVGIQTGAATLENSMKFPQKLNIKPLYNSAITPLGIYPKKSKTLKIELRYGPAVALLGIYPKDT